MVYPRLLAFIAAAWLFQPSALLADMALSKVIVEFRPGEPLREDVEVINAGNENLYLVVEPREVIQPGTDAEERVERRNPQEVGLLVSPTRVVIEPGARRIVRLSLFEQPAGRDRIWRVTFRPVVGETSAQTSALRVLTAYSVLVMAYPPAAAADVAGSRAGRRVALENRGNSNALLFDGRQCDAAGNNCRDLPTRRLYAGNRWQVDLPYDTPAQWRVQDANGTRDLTL